MADGDVAVHEEAARVFRDRLRGRDPLDVVREVITHGSSAILDDSQYAQLRMRLGEALGISPNRDVFMVGSAKLGFSIKQGSRYRRFEDTSDVDVAVVSPELYCRLWAELRRFHRQGGSWPKDDLNHFKNDHLN